MTALQDSRPLDYRVTNVVCGRRFCSACKRWRHVYEFSPVKWRDEPHCTRIQQTATECRTCHTVRRRERAGYQPFKPGLRGEARRARHRELAAKREQDEAYREERRRRQREWAAAKRREAGIPPRNLRKKPALPTSTEMVPVEPLLKWIEENTRPVTSNRGKPLRSGAATPFFGDKADERPALHQLQERAGWGGPIRALLKPGERIPLGRVDSLLTAAGAPHQLNELYPLEDTAESRAA